MTWHWGIDALPARHQCNLRVADVAEEWGRLNAKRPLPSVDSLLAATATVRGLILATRNIGDLGDVGVRVVNPFEFGVQ